MNTTPSWDAFIEFARGLAGKQLATYARGKPFTIQVVGDTILYTPGATGAARPQPRQRTEMCLELYEKTGSLNTHHYQKITVNASYFLTVLRLYLASRP